jgi:precorrin-2 dehydrogenase / sirohydrochlorin ferrochelatase
MNQPVLNKEFMPVALNIRDKKILLIGGGRIALHKISSLKQYQAELHVLALEVCEEIKGLEISYTEKAYDSADLKGAFLVYACTNMKSLNEQVYHDCHASGILVNVVDNPPLCDFVSPAIYKRGYMSVAVSSNAHNVYKSIEVRNKIKGFLEDDNSLPL